MASFVRAAMSPVPIRSSACFRHAFLAKRARLLTSNLPIISNLLLLIDVFELCLKLRLVVLSYPSSTPGALKVETATIRLRIKDIVIVLEKNKAATGASIFGVLWYLISSCLAHLQTSCLLSICCVLPYLHR